MPRRRRSAAAAALALALGARAQTLTIPALANGWSSKGCITDSVNARTLSGDNTATSTMTIEACISFCTADSWVFAGVEFGSQCFCGNDTLASATAAPASSCNEPCAGNAAEPCGAGNFLNLFWSGVTPPPPPAVVPAVGPWVSLGCFTDGVNGLRSLPNGVATTGAVTIESCTAACFAAGFPIAGAEFATQCFCNTAITNGGAPTPASACNMPCAGNGSEFCGGPNALNVYNFTGTNLPTTPTPPQGGGGGGGGASSNLVQQTSGLPAGWAFNACWVDNLDGRIFIDQQPGNAANTPLACIQQCVALNFSVAGMEFADECYCGDSLVDGAAIATDQTTCNMGCAGNASLACGGPNRLSVYASAPITALPIPVIQKTGLPGGWQYAGCLRENTTNRIFDNQIIWIGNNSAIACMNQCAEFGYPASGTEFGQECYCGDITDIAAGNGVFGADSECNEVCPGDPLHICGDGDRLTTYFWNKTGVAPLTTWHSPANTGFYEVRVCRLVVPLIATVGINGKVTFLEKGGTGIPNATGAYELDLSLVNDFSKTWREMHIVTDVFCSGSVILPDKAGRQINVGGWSEISTFGLRLYTPSGSAGVNGTTDWEENAAELSLQVGRWYPTAAILANGSILVMGGETGSNAAPQPNLEVLPKPAGGSTVIDLDFLARTDPNNLYPFIIVLPSKNLFVGYYNEARILEPVNFNTITQLPNIPGSVNNFLAGRTYPLEGTAVPFPMTAPYTDPLTILICGGGGIGANSPLDNCVTIQPEVPNANWTIERMPTRRVMPNIVSLPDGTFMILNGAMQGVAGFGLANDPNFQALLYDPTQALGSRISFLNTTIVARMYHSEAILLPDGRVLVSGSDPETDNPDGTVKYPEEFRIEVYIPPYLNQGHTQPTFSLAVTDWTYGGVFTITNVKLFQGPASAMRVSLIAATSSTHGNAMGARTLFPAFTCAGTSCQITAPPNAGISPPGWHQLFILDGPTPSHSVWVRIGGDPSQLGNWPNLPGFTVPGV
ncbi:copper radical oxidase [Hypholoma sublateritium FD-334 SS-4]|uniref:Copper radical oxidase n=1 Tax=Hypholoma sublateritium (strain FD-334 SS-4) TaxID=945553 RepID=A0A0D2KW88_HYPSF|nr:copper radical oxidase [Hypholoma sublateritium FD-334 SS-4]